eukprot:CAMPEP_0117605016 /NCGR_PEP_ID=MMETSP0784-20121206/78980_1 /TAXON_ID=39447 /ORGANISM="" /LENGTH=213 /DNA_ID=CAMNT_0005408055 /DNA_START=39 /DNA_END=681 /DNA_ORIENTATION=-
MKVEAPGSVHRRGMDVRPIAPAFEDEVTFWASGCSASMGLGPLMAVRGAGLAVLGAVVMLGGCGSGPRKKWRRIWRRLTRSQEAGRRAIRADKRPPLFGPEKTPGEPKRMYRYYCNKMYKVIRECSPGDVEAAPSLEASWEPTARQGILSWLWGLGAAQKVEAHLAASDAQSGGWTPGDPGRQTPTSVRAREDSWRAEADVQVLLQQDVQGDP